MDCEGEGSGLTGVIFVLLVCCFGLVLVYLKPRIPKKKVPRGTSNTVRFQVLKKMLGVDGGHQYLRPEKGKLLLGFGQVFRCSLKRLSDVHNSLIGTLSSILNQLAPCVSNFTYVYPTVWSVESKTVMQTMSITNLDIFQLSGVGK